MSKVWSRDKRGELRRSDAVDMENLIRELLRRRTAQESVGVANLDLHIARTSRAALKKGL